MKGIIFQRPGYASFVQHMSFVILPNLRKTSVGRVCLSVEDLQLYAIHLGDSFPRWFGGF